MGEVALASGVAFWVWMMAALGASVWAWRHLQGAGKFPTGASFRDRMLLAEDLVRSRFGHHLLAFAVASAVLAVAISAA